MLVRRFRIGIVIHGRIRFQADENNLHHCQREAVRSQGAVPIRERAAGVHRRGDVAAVTDPDVGEGVPDRAKHWDDGLSLLKKGSRNSGRWIRGKVHTCQGCGCAGCTVESCLFPGRSPMPDSGQSGLWLRVSHAYRPGCPNRRCAVRRHRQAGRKCCLLVVQGPVRFPRHACRSRGTGLGSSGREIGSCRNRQFLGWMRYQWAAGGEWTGLAPPVVPVHTIMRVCEPVGTGSGHCRRGCGGDGGRARRFGGIPRQSGRISVFGSYGSELRPNENGPGLVAWPGPRGLVGEYGEGSPTR